MEWIGYVVVGVVVAYAMRGVFPVTRKLRPGMTQEAALDELGPPDEKEVTGYQIEVWRYEEQAIELTWKEIDGTVALAHWVNT